MGIPSSGVSGRDDGRRTVDDGTPQRCPACDGLVRADERPGWLFCPGCEWPVWMALTPDPSSKGRGETYWVATPPPGSEGVQERFERGLAAILGAVQDALVLGAQGGVG